MDWISVKDRLPEDNNRVLVYGPEYAQEMLFGHYYKDDEWSVWSYEAGPFNGNGAKGICITHWMPLPPPPTNDSEG